MALDVLTEFLRNSICSLTKSVCLAGVGIEENGSIDNGQGYKHLVVGEDTLGVLLGLQWKGKEPRGEAHRDNVANAVTVSPDDGSNLAGNLLFHNVNLLPACEIGRVLREKLQSCLLVELLDVLFPLRLTQSLAPVILATLASVEASAVAPDNAEFLLLVENKLDVRVGSQAQTRRLELRPVPRVVRLPTKVLHYNLVLARDGHRVVCVNGIRLEPVGERASGQLIEHTALVDIEVIADLVVTPVGQVTSIVINLFMSISNRFTKSQNLPCSDDHHGPVPRRRIEPHERWCK